MFSFEAGYRCISLAIAIKSLAINLGLMLKKKSSCLFYFNSASLSVAGMYYQSE